MSFINAKNKKQNLYATIFKKKQWFENVSIKQSVNLNESKFLAQFEKTVTRKPFKIYDENEISFCPFYRSMLSKVNSPKSHFSITSFVGFMENTNHANH